MLRNSRFKIAAGLLVLLAAGAATPGRATTIYYLPQGFPEVCGQDLSASEPWCIHGATRRATPFCEADVPGLKLAQQALGLPRCGAPDQSASLSGVRFVFLVDDRSPSPELRRLMGDALRDLGQGELVYPSRGRAGALAFRYDFIAVGERLFELGVGGDRDSQAAWLERVGIVRDERRFLQHLLDEIPAQVNQYIERYVSQTEQNWGDGLAMYDGALEQFESTMVHASVSELTPDFWEVLGQTVFRFMLDKVIGSFPAMGEISVLARGSGDDYTAPKIEFRDLKTFAPVVEAFTGHFGSGPRSGTVGEWIQDVRNRFLAQRRGLLRREDLVREWQTRYARLSPDLRQGFETEIRAKIEEARSFRAPHPLELERELYEDWINAQYSAPENAAEASCQMQDGTGGCLEIWFERRDESPGSLVRASLATSESERVGDRINRLSDMGAQSKTTLFLLGVRKRVCFVTSYTELSRSPLLGGGWRADGEAYRRYCGWLGPNHQVLTEPEDEDARRRFRAISGIPARSLLAWKLADRGFN